MNERHEPDDRELREMFARLEREFQQRPPLPDDAPVQPPIVEEIQSGPRRVRLTLPLARPRAIFVLLAANVILYAVSVLLANAVGWNEALLFLGAKYNPAIDAGQWWRLLTPVVLHGSLMHLVFNSWALYALGTEAEQVYGTLRFLVVYALAGLAGSIASYTFNPSALSVGASGAIFGLLGALAAFSYTSRSFIGWEASKMQLGQMATLAAINLAFGFAVPNIDNSAHIGGLIIGGIAGLALAPRYAIERAGYMPMIERRDPPLVGWIVAAVLLVGLIAWFVLGRP
jgi:rhomboid protease GluP